MTPPAESPKARLDRCREEGLRLYVVEGHTLEQVQKALELGGDRLSLTTIKRWSLRAGWGPRRTKLLRERDTRTFKEARKILREGLSKKIERSARDTEKLLDRSIKILLNGGDFCEHCGQGSDTAHNSYSPPKPRDIVALDEHHLKILGYYDALGGDAPAVDAFPAVPADFLAELGDLLAKHESLPVVQLNPETGAVAEAGSTSDDDEYRADDA